MAILFVTSRGTEITHFTNNVCVVPHIDADLIVNLKILYLQMGPIEGKSNQSDMLRMINLISHSGDLHS